MPSDKHEIPINGTVCNSMSVGNSHLSIVTALKDVSNTGEISSMPRKSTNSIF